MSHSQSSDRPRRRRSRAHATASVRVQRLPALLLLMLALTMLITGGRMGLAGIARYQAEAFISAWAKAGNEPSPHAWQIAQGAAQRAIGFYPVANGDYLDRLGRVHSWQYFRQPYGMPALQASREKALQAYRAAVAARPNWPYTWARLAHSKLYLQQFDAEFNQAFAHAAALGPWRIGVNRELAEIGFHAWPQLADTQREMTLESARRSVAYSWNEAKNMRRLAESSSGLSILCNSLSSELKTRKAVCI